MRYYNTKHGLFPSVTTIIKETEPQEKKIQRAKRIENYQKKEKEQREKEKERQRQEWDLQKTQGIMDALNAGDIELAKQIANRKYGEVGTKDGGNGDGKDSNGDDRDSHAENVAKSQNRGNVIHDLAFKYLVMPRYDRDEFENLHPIPEELKGYWQNLEPELRIMGKPILLECPIVNSALGYAGRIDTYCYHNDLKVLMDYKTYQGWEVTDPKTGEVVKRFDTWFLFKKLKKGEKYEWRFDKLSDNLQYAALQSVAYRLGLQSMGLEVDEVRIVVVNPRAVQRITIPQEIWPELEDVWQRKVTEFHKAQSPIDTEKDEIVGLGTPGFINEHFINFELF